MEQAAQRRSASSSTPRPSTHDRSRVALPLVISRPSSRRSRSGTVPRRGGALVLCAPRTPRATAPRRLTPRRHVVGSSHARSPRFNTDGASREAVTQKPGGYTSRQVDDGRLDHLDVPPHLPIRDGLLPQPVLMLPRPAKVLHKLVAKHLPRHAPLSREARRRLL